MPFKDSNCSSASSSAEASTEEPAETKSPNNDKKQSTLKELYRFADIIDYQIMAVGMFFALIQAILPPFAWLFMGDFMTYAIHREEVKLNRSRELIALTSHNKGTSLNLTTKIVSNSSFHVNSTHLMMATKQAEYDRRFEQTATPAFLMMLSFSVATFLAAFLQRFSWEFSSIRQVFKAKKVFIQKLLYMDVAWLESKHSGQVASMLHEQADSIHHGIADHIPMTMFIFCYLVVTISVCCYIRWDVTIVILMAFPVLIGARVVFSKWFCKTVEEEGSLLAKIANLVTETFNCIRTVIAFGAQKQTLIKFERLTIQHRRLMKIRLRASSIYDSLAQILFTELILTAALFYGIWQVGDTNPGRLGALAINMLYICVTSVTIGFHLSGISMARKSAKEMQLILNEKPVIETDCPGFINQWAKRRKFALQSVHPIDPLAKGIGRKKSVETRKCPMKISFRNVRFSYPSRPEIEVLKGISLTISAGEHLAIVGPSGSGKSTLTALILRFYDPVSGKIEIDGEDLCQMDPGEVRARIGLVSQEPALFDGTISENILHGRLNATQAEINEAARKTESWGFINALPEGMRTRVGDRGLQLSGGQKQRIAICRAVIRKPALIIFDEATSALDNRHEVEVQRAIEIAQKGISSITISHRLSTIRNADRVIVLDAGEIVEEGPPAELLANKDSRFYRMWLDQRLAAAMAANEAFANTNTKSPPNSPPSSPPPTSKAFVVKKSPTFFGMRRTSSLAPADFSKERQSVKEKQKRAWSRSSLRPSAQHNAVLNRSYSVRSMDRQSVVMPFPAIASVTKMKPMLERTFSFRKDVMQFPLGDGDHHSLDSFNASSTDQPDKKTSGSIKTIWKLLKQYRPGYLQLAFALPTAIFRGVFFLLICFEVASVLEIVLAPPEETNERIFFVAAIYVALIIIKTIMEAIGRLLIALYGHGFCDFLRFEMFRNVLRHGAAYFDEEKNSPGRLTYKIITETATLNRILGSKLDLLVPAAVSALVSISIALAINWRLTLFCGFQFPAFLLLRLVQFREAGKRQRQMAEEERKAANLASVILCNMSTIKAYCLQRHFYDIYCEFLTPLQRAMKWQSLVSSFVFACQFSFTYILIAITLYFGKVMILNDLIDPFDFLRVVLLTQFGANYLSQMVASITDISKAYIAAESIIKVIQESPSDMDNLSDEGFQPKPTGRIALQDVDFRYPSRAATRILRNLNLDVKPGKFIAIVGPSGSGKSTIIALMQHLYNPSKGRVLFEGHDIRSINPNYLHRVVVSVAQEPTLFSFSIRENIAYGLPEAEVTLEQVIEAAKIANIHDFIISLPQGYETIMGECAQVSGGQKQRIALARALIRKPAVLLLDEATAALDTASEKAVQSALEQVSKNCTCIQVSHRLSSIRSADEIVVLVDGKIMEQGSHEELMARRGLYFEMNKLEN